MVPAAKAGLSVCPAAELGLGELRALDPGPDLGERGLARGRDIVAERGEAAIVGAAEPLRTQMLSRFQNALAHLLGSLDARVDGIGDADIDRLPGPPFARDDVQRPRAVRLARHLHEEAPGIDGEQVRQQLGIVDIGGMRRILVAAGAGMHPDAGALGVGEARQHRVVEGHEIPQQSARRVELAAQPALGEIDLHAVGAGVEGRTDVLLALVHQVGDEGLARIAVDPVLRIDQRDRRGRNDRLLHRPAGMGLRRGDVAPRIGRVAKRPGGEHRQLAGVAVLERDRHAVGRQRVQAGERIGREARFGLLAVGNHGRTRRLHGGDGLGHGALHGAAQTGGVQAAICVCGHGLDQITGTRDAADRFGGNGRGH